MASDDVVVRKVALCSAIFAGFAYVGYSIIRSAFCRKGHGREEKGTRKLCKLRRRKKHKSGCCSGSKDKEHIDMATRSSQTDLTVPIDFTTTSPAELHFIPKSVRDKVRELNLKARMFDERYFAQIFKPRSLQNSPWNSPKMLSPVDARSFMSRSAENIHVTSPPSTPLRRRSSTKLRHWNHNDLSVNCIDGMKSEKDLYIAMVKESDDLLYNILHGLYNKARVMTLYEAKCLVAMLNSRDEDILVKTLTTISNCAAFTINQDYLSEVGCLPILKDHLNHDCLAVQVASTQAVANMAVNERNQQLLQPCIPFLLAKAVSSESGRYLQSVSLLALTNLALSDDSHIAFLSSLHQLCTIIETADNTIRLQTLKLLVNLSCNINMVPYLLAAKAPQNLHTLIDTKLDREVTLRILTYLANVVASAAKHNITLKDLPSDHKAASPETLYAAIYGNTGRECLSKKTKAMVLSSDEDISFQASRIYDVLNR